MAAAQARSSHASPIALIAGGGTLPAAVAEAIAADGGTPIVFALRGIADAGARARFRYHDVALGRLGRLFDLLGREGCREVVFIGALTRPALREIRLDLTTVRAMPALYRAFRGGDDHILRGVAALFERRGFRLRGAGEIAPRLLLPAGLATRAAPDAAAQADIDKGRAVLAALGPYDVGQACVVIDGHVVATEDIGGTDALLVRVAHLRRDGRLRTRAGRGVLVKMPKPGQDIRFDMPALGVATIAGAAAAGLAGVAAAAGATLVAEPQATIDAADRAALFVVGIAP